MRTVNKVILIGNVTRDPLVKNTENSKKVALFHSLPTDIIKHQNEKTNQKVNFITV